MRRITERNLRAVDLNLLVVFDALMTERSVTRAAEKNGLSQPAVSKALGRLRHMFADPLFVRRDRAMEPTERAKVLAGPINAALRDISRTLTQSAFDPAQSKARVQVASIDLYHTRLIPELVRRLRTQAPNVDLHVHALESARVREHLASGEIALAFAPFETRGDEFRSLPLWTDYLVTLVSSKSGIESLTPEAFAAAPHVADAGHVHIKSDGTVTSVVDALLGARGLKRHIALVLPTAAGLPHIVASTDLIATLPSKIAMGLGSRDDVRRISCPFEIAVTPHMIWHAKTDADQLLSWVRRIAADIASEMSRDTN
jgi:DNA-binding transcriptional LysR family regulator